MVKVLQFGMTGNLGGMETYLLTQYRQLDRSLIRYDFVKIDKDIPLVFADEIIQNGDKLYQVITRKSNPLLHYWQVFSLLYVHRHEYKAVVLNTCHLYYVFPLVAAMLVGIPMRIIHSHNNSNEDVGISLVIVIRRFGKFLNKFLLKLSATNYWACSKLAGEWMFGKHPFDIIHNAIDTKKFIYNKELRSIVREKLNLHDEFIIGNVARFSYQKNHEFLIDIFNEIVKRKANSILLLVGDNAADHTYLDMTIAKIKQLHLEKKVIFLGMRKDVNRLYQAMDVFILPSHFEGLPIVGLEAQAAGLRCYFSDTITKELEITNLANYLPLGNAMIWAEKILKEPVYKRCNMEQEIIDRGYDITSEVKKIEDFFLK